MSWFDGTAPRTDEEAVFLSTLRGEAAAWSLDVTPDDTSSFAGLAPLYVDVSIPGLPRGANRTTILQGAYWAGATAGPTLHAEWGSEYLLDSGRHDDDLRHVDVLLGPAQAASILAKWFEAQLRRPVERFDWVKAEGMAVASEWRLGDTGRLLASDGSWLRRRRAPTTSVAVRPRHST